MNSMLNRIMKYLLDVLLCGGAVLWVALPFLVPRLWRYYRSVVLGIAESSVNADGSGYTPMLISVMLAGALALLILYELRKMMITVLRDDCFVESNVVSLRRMGIYAFLIAGIYACRLFLLFTLTGLTVTVVFVIAGLLSEVLARVFERAVSYKLENDLTI